MCHLDENAERRYFEKHPEKGRFVWWPTNGTKLDAYNRSAADAAAKVRQWNSTLRSVVLAGSIPCRRGSMRSSGSSKHLVPTTGALDAIYIHCQGGKDRTGEVSGSYYLRHMNITLQEATTLDHNIAGRPIGSGNQRAMDMVLHLPVRSPKVQPQLSQACGVTGESLLTW